MRSIIVVLGLMAMLVSFSSLNSYAETTLLSVKTDSAYYKIGDTVEITGFVKNPSADVLTLSVFNSDADIILVDQINLDEKNSFLTTLLLSEGWEDSKFYVVTVKMNDEIAATSFELKLVGEEKQVTESKEESKLETHITEPVVIEEPDEKQKLKTTFPEKTSQLPQKLADNFYQNPVFVLVIIVIVAGIMIGVAYSKKLPNIESIKHKPQPLITFENPAPAQVHLKDGTSISYESWENIPIDQKHNVATVEFWIQIKNSGGDVARNISSAFLKEDDVFTRQDLVKKELKPLPDLAPGEFYYHNFEISWDRFVKLRVVNIFVGLLISYAKQQTKGHSGIIFGIGMGSNYIIDEWFT